MIDRITNFVRGLGTIPQQINDNYTGFLNPSPTLNDFSFIEDEQERIKAAQRAQQQADQQADFNRLGLALSFLQSGQPRTTPGLDFTPISNALANINQNMMRQRTLAPQQEFNRLLQPLQLEQIQATINNLNRKNQPSLFNYSKQRGINLGTASDDVTNKMINELNTSIQNMEKGETTPVAKDNSIQSKYANLEKYVFPDQPISITSEGARTAFQKDFSIRNANYNKTKTRVDRFFDNNKQINPDSITQNELANIYDIYSSTSPGVKPNEEIEKIFDQIKARADIDLVKFGDNTYFKEAQTDNKNLFRFKTDKPYSKRVINGINNLYTEYYNMKGAETKPERDSAERAFNKQLEDLQQLYQMKLDGLKPDMKSSEIQKFIQDKVINKPEELPSTAELSVVDPIENVSEEIEKIADDAVVVSTDKTGVKRKVVDGKTYKRSELVNKSKFKKRYTSIGLSNFFNRDRQQEVHTKIVQDNIDAGFTGNTLKEKINQDKTAYSADIADAKLNIPALLKYSDIIDRVYDKIIVDKNDSEEVKREKNKFLNAVTTEDSNLLFVNIEKASNQFENVEEFDIFKSLLVELGTNTFLDVLRELKSAGQSGSSGLGSLSNAEGAKLQNSIGFLGLTTNEAGDPIVSPVSKKLMVENIKRLKKQMESSIRQHKMYFLDKYELDL